jgi:hypothetical protein
MEPIEKIPELIRGLYEIVDELEQLFPDRHFTLDGHLVGSIGEVLARYHYDITLLPTGTKTHDGQSPDGKKVQIKATQRNQIDLTSEPDYLLVFKIKSDGTSEEVYNGPGHLVWNQNRDGLQSVSVNFLRKLLGQVASKDKITRIRS